MVYLSTARKVTLLLAIGVIGGLSFLAIQMQNGRQSGSLASARDAAPADLTGYWVSVVTEDWRWRMALPPKGDYAGVPLNEQGRGLADMWESAPDRANEVQCRAFGAAAIMRIPGRIHVAWADDDTLRIETDAGQQERLLHFAPDQWASGDPSWQGHSVASWQKAEASDRNSLQRLTGLLGQSGGGNLKVVSNGLRPGHLRWNGVPYSMDAVITEYFDLHTTFGVEWMTVTVVVEDSEYLTERFIVSSHFKREPDGSKWNPRPCTVPQITVGE